MFQRLSSDCEDQIQIILQESALDYRLDPQLQLQCTHEVRVPALHQSKAASCDTMTSRRTSTFVCVCVCADFQVMCRGSCCSGADRAGGGVFEGEPVEDQTGRMQEGNDEHQTPSCLCFKIKAFRILL